MANTVTIYTIMLDNAPTMLETMRPHYSLAPWEQPMWDDHTIDARDYSGDDDGGVEYVLPDGFVVSETVMGDTAIFDGKGNHWDIVPHSSGRPQLVGGNPHYMPVLDKA
jgi:hypothetical protein